MDYHHTEMIPLQILCYFSSLIYLAPYKLNEVIFGWAQWIRKYYKIWVYAHGYFSIYLVKIWWGLLEHPLSLVFKTEKAWLNAIGAKLSADIKSYQTHRTSAKCRSVKLHYNPKILLPSWLCKKIQKFNYISWRYKVE